ncbi:sensor histidine kinase [Novosphingobium terrae]|uniref:sensor histidine kinase n=1 Tax=Novosphingobium terrae TaxID=2726189 RepID=UPI00197D740D|nr:ATP-binding protein [Novosphingobium terrae]
MGLGRRFRSFNSAAFRFALIIAGVFALASTLLLGMVRHQVGHYAHEAMAGSLTAETRTLLAHKNDLAEEIRRRIAADSGGTFSYLLLDPQGRVVAGTILPAAAHAGWGKVTMVERGPLGRRVAEPEELHMLGTRLSDGSLLVVATDAFDVDKLSGHMARFTKLWAASVTVLALLGGWVAGWFFLARLADANAAIARIMAGRTEQRLPMIGFAPELDDLARNLNRMLDRIDGLMAGLRQVSTDVAHDLRTPLTRLRQHLEGLQEEARGTPGMESGLEDALAQTDQVLGTFRAILRLAQVEGGGSRAPFAPVDLGRLAAALVETYEPVASDSDHTLVARIGAGQAMVLGDGDLLAQLLANVIENAIIHTPAGTRVSVAVSTQGGHVALTIADNGPGVTADHRPHLVRRFYQADPSRSAGSAGLGLAMAHAIAHLHGVELEIGDARPGLTVSVTFPLA